MSSARIRRLLPLLAYDSEDDRYVLDPMRTGAPATGVRCVLHDEVVVLGIILS